MKAKKHIPGPYTFYAVQVIGGYPILDTSNNLPNAEVLLEHHRNDGGIMSDRLEIARYVQVPMPTKAEQKKEHAFYAKAVRACEKDWEARGLKLE